MSFTVLGGCRNAEPTDDYSAARVETQGDQLAGPQVSSSVSVAPTQPGTSEQPGSSGPGSSDAESTQASPTWEEQLARIRSGEAYTLKVETPAGPSLLEALPDLDGKLLELLIDQGGPTDSWLMTIAQLSSLEHLRIRESPISDLGLTYLVAGGERLQILNLPQSTLTEQGIRELAKLPQLKQLRIGGRQIDDAAASALSELPNLRSLHLIGPAISADGLAALAASRKLSSLYIDDCPLPDSAWQELFRAKPQLHVHIDQHHHDRDPNTHSH
ncbi:MAG: hypothetical protein NXI32_01000 [bacterium]|nr:hypothetical protein [bacterium]